MRGASCRAGTSPISARPTISPSSFRPASRRSATCPRRAASRAPDGSSVDPLPDHAEPCPPICSSSRSASSTGSPRPPAAPRSASSPGAARASRAAGRWKARRGSCPGTTNISARPIRCPSSTISPGRAPASSSARWRIGGRSSRSRASCSSIRRSPPSRAARAIFEVAAHEIAHQWFGDLVTMSWWDDLWLNEGFASWMATKATAALHPEWEPLLGRIDGREAAINARFAADHPSGRAARSPPSSRSARPSTRSPIRRARRSSPCSKTMSARMRGGAACRPISRATGSATRRATICGARSRRRRAGR